MSMATEHESESVRILNCLTRQTMCNEKHHRVAPLSSGVMSPGKGSVVYAAHPYHTKMPIEVIIPHITHYTKPGDVVLDPFCGTGMTGVAALTTGRKVILVDLSPAACHIAHCYVNPTSPQELQAAGATILCNARNYETERYATRCRKCGGVATIAYTIWSAEVRCACGNNFVLWDVAVDKRTGEVKRDSACPACNKHVRGHSYARVRYVPVITVYDCEGACVTKRQEAPVNEHEIQLVYMSKIKAIPWWSPNDSMMGVKSGERWGEQWRAGYHREITRVKDFYTSRAWASLAFLHDQIRHANPAVKKHLLFTFTACLPAVSRMVKYLPTRGGRSNTPGTLYLPALSLEQNVFRVFERRLRRVISLVKWQLEHHFHADNACVLTASVTNLDRIPDNSIDYIFTDPPFAENIQYAELNFLVEAWLKEYTNTNFEGVISRTRGLGPEHFATIMNLSFKEMARVLKPDHYSSVVFHNTSARNWQLLMAAVRAAGFQLESMTFIDKGQASWNQVASEYAANFDPVLQLMKGRGGHHREVTRPKETNKSEQDIIEIIRRHLGSRPKLRHRTTAYIHSLVIRHLLLTGKEGFIPPPKKLASRLEHEFKKQGRFWFCMNEEVSPTTLDAFS